VGRVAAHLVAVAVRGLEVLPAAAGRAVALLPAGAVAGHGGVPARRGAGARGARPHVAVVALQDHTSLLVLHVVSAHGEQVAALAEALVVVRRRVLVHASVGERAGDTP